MDIGTLMSLGATILVVMGSFVLAVIVCCLLVAFSQQQRGR